MLATIYPDRRADAVKLHYNGLISGIGVASRDLFDLHQVGGQNVYQAEARRREEMMMQAYVDASARAKIEKAAAAQADLNVKVVADPTLPPNVVVARNEATGEEVRATVSRSSRSELARQCANRAHSALAEKRSAEAREQYAATMVALREAKLGGAPMSVRGPLLNKAEALLSQIRDPEPLYRWQGDPSCPHCFSFGVCVTKYGHRKPCECVTGAVPTSEPTQAQCAFIERELAKEIGKAIAAGPSAPPAKVAPDVAGINALFGAAVLLGEQRGEPDP